MKDTRGYVENRQLHTEGYLQENRVELESNAGALSIPSTSKKDANSGKEYAMGLLDVLLETLEEDQNQA